MKNFRQLRVHPRTPGLSRRSLGPILLADWKPCHIRSTQRMPYPAKKNPKLIEEVLSRIAQGETLAALGRELDFHPQSWADWMRADEDLAVAYQRARDVGSDALAEQALALIDQEPARVEGRVDAGHVAWRRAQVDTRLKLLA